MYPDFYVVTEITKKSDEDINKFVLMLGKGVLGFLTPPQLAWQTASKKYKRKIRIITDINMSLVFKKGIRGESW